MMRHQTRLRLRAIAVVTGMSTVLGVAYPLLFVRPVSSMAILIGLYLGMMMPLSAFAFEYLYVRRQRGAWIRRLPFGIFALVKFVTYLVLVLVNIAASIFVTIPEARAKGAFREFWLQVVDLQTITMSLSMFLLFSVGIALNDLLGRGVLVNFLTGRYHRPRREKRMFVFIDMVGSTALAERLGDLEYHRLLNRFFSDIAGPIVENRGYVTNYIGDELIATWPQKKAATSELCVRAVRQAQKILEENRGLYEREFGVLPSFRAGLHTGDVVIGEMGEFKREIVFVGDVMNTTSRIQAACRDLGRQFLVSQDVMSDLQKAEDLEAEDMGEVILRGKGVPLHLYAVSI